MTPCVQYIRMIQSIRCSIQCIHWGRAPARRPQADFLGVCGGGGAPPPKGVGIILYIPPNSSAVRALASLGLSAFSGHSGGVRNAALHAPRLVRSGSALLLVGVNNRKYKRKIAAAKAVDREFDRGDIFGKPACFVISMFFSDLVAFLFDGPNIILD